MLRALDRRIDVKLANITVPARGQPLWHESWQSLRELCYGKAATLLETGTALDGGTIGEVTCGGSRADEEQLRRGMAQLEPPFRELDSVLRAAQNEARAAAVGIWRRN